MLTRSLLAICLVFGPLGIGSLAVILNDSNPDPAEHRTAPTGPLANSGWQWQGTWGGFLGTAVAAHFFITAKHCGGKVGGQFTCNGVSYTTVKRFDCPNADLTLWEVSGTFPSYASLYTGSDEQGKRLVVFGRGTERGEPVIVANSVPAGSDRKGWLWGPGRGVMRWGTNTVSGIVDGGANIGPLLAATFDASAGIHEAHLSSGDSGGAMFIQDGSTWKLAGINYSVDDFNKTKDGKGFNAALFDCGGLYTRTDHSPEWTPVPDGPIDVPSHFYATRISTHVTWINSVVEQGDPDVKKGQNPKSEARNPRQVEKP